MTAAVRVFCAAAKAENPGPVTPSRTPCLKTGLELTMAPSTDVLARR
jgi:hypothetical protein